MKEISGMSKEDIIAELVSYQRDALNQLDIADLAHHLIHFRTIRFNQEQHDGAGLKSPDTQMKGVTLDDIRSALTRDHVSQTPYL